MSVTEGEDKPLTYPHGCAASVRGGGAWYGWLRARLGKRAAGR
jgi:hypothetical protein